MTIIGSPNGDSGGMALRGGQFRGRWEVCMKTAAGSANYVPVMLLWASSTGGVNSPGGEVDFAEIFGNASRQRVGFFLHWPNNAGRSSAAIDKDATKWHSWAVEWTSTAIVGYVDGVEWFRDSNPAHFPVQSAALCLQLSNMGGDISAGGRMDFDWARQYLLG
jgi:licheninase